MNKTEAGGRLVETSCSLERAILPVTYRFHFGRRSISLTWDRQLFACCCSEAAVLLSARTRHQKILLIWILNYCYLGGSGHKPAGRRLAFRHPRSPDSAPLSYDHVDDGFHP
ncbi:hypothetical protein [Aurantimonas coralicida]|uniref:hypothetical protein n=1 Tax=Aurantimonas coralicida TaxID=182270 RepID=UPI0012DE971C|nr:hypothetical protein [Aurantimonas coralicida]